MLPRVRSLRARLLLMTAAVLAVALGTVALVSTRAVSVEILQHMNGRGPRPPGLDGIAAELAALRERTGGWAGAHALLAAAGRRLDRDLLVVTPDGRLAAASGPEGSYGAVRIDGGGARIRVERRSAQGTGEMALLEPYRAEIRGAGGARLGTLFVTPVPPVPGANPVGPAGIVRRINRALLLAVLAAGAAALLLSFTLARQILKPVEALTAAARRLEAGDLDPPRVPADGRDEIGELARAFNSMAERRATAERLRRDLVGDVAHELRSPLTNIRCQVEALQDGLVPASAEVLASLHEEARHLETLIDDLQDLALAEAGQLELERGPLDLAQEVERALRAVRPLAAAKGLEVAADLPAGLPPVDADARRLAQILRNLLGNAVTHSPGGGRVRVSARQQPGEVEVAVKDSGPGIPPEHLPFVFERFYRADASRSRATGGAGLGLAIVRQLAAAHGGRAWAESPPGRGARFAFTLPSAPAAPAEERCADPTP